MIFLRFACLLAGMLALVVPPMLLFPSGAVTFAPSSSAALLAAQLLAASSFFFIAVAGHRIKRSPRLARLCALVLLAPFAAGAATLWRGVEPTALWLGGALLGFTLIVGLALVLVMLQGPSAGRLRARERRQQRLPALRHG
ncbi:hypothetical protein [Massilia sp. LjRoot122]|uniref:hypothetical protein n=1 Tax=Massilia sp. LjRoot122 TaxID=3342257 RepID=UPI003ECCF59C